MKPTAWPLEACPVYRISAGDTNKFLLLVGRDRDATGFVSVIEIFDAGGRTPPNSHRYAEEMFYVLHGEGIATCGSEQLTLRRGSWFVVHPGSEHVVENTGKERLYCLTTMVPDEDFAALIRAGVPDRLDETDLRVLQGA